MGFSEDFQNIANDLAGAFGDIFTAGKLYKKQVSTMLDGPPSVYDINKIMIEDTDSQKGQKIFGEKFKPDHKYALIPSLSITGSIKIDNGDTIKTESDSYLVEDRKVDAAGAAYELLLSVIV